MKYYTTVNGKEFTVEIDQEDQITVNGETYRIDFQQLPEGGTLSLLIDNRSLEAIVGARDAEAWEVLLHGELYNVHVQDERTYRLAQARGVLADELEEVAVKSPMPGVILDVLVAEGDAVAQGDKVVILESMKMENELRAARDGVVLRVLVQVGQNVDKNQDLVVIGDAEESA